MRRRIVNLILQLQGRSLTAFQPQLRSSIRIRRNFYSTRSGEGRIEEKDHHHHTHFELACTTSRGGTFQGRKLLHTAGFFGVSSSSLLRSQSKQTATGFPLLFDLVHGYWIGVCFEGI